MKTKLLLMMLAAAALFALSASADADEIPIPNAGFEDRTMADGSLGWWRTHYNPDSWCGADPDGSGAGEYESELYQWNPGPDGGPTGNWTWNSFDGIAPEGDNIVVVDNYDSGIAQLLTETFDHTKTYQLTAQVAGLEDSYWGSWWYGYGLEILVGGTKNLATTYGTIEGGTRIAYIERTEEECGFDLETFYLVKLTYIPDEADAYLDGQPLQIRVMSHSDNGYAFFDDVKLYAGLDLITHSPYDGEIVPAGLVELSWTNLDPNDPADPVFVDVWFGTEPNELSPDYDYSKVVDAGEDTNSVTVDASVAGTYYWQVDSYIEGATGSGPIGDPIEGPVWTFYAVSDFPPESVVIDTPDMITWSGQGVQLDATVIGDDGASALTYAWSTTSYTSDVTVEFSDPNTEDPIVTVTKDFSAVPIVNAGFEDPVLADGVWDVPPGWDLVGGEIWTVNPSDGGGGYDCFGGIAPEGENIGISGGSGDENGLAQVLTETLAADTTYELTVEVGRNTLYDWVGYRVQLLAGGTVLAEDDDSMNISPDTFETSTVTHISGGVSDPNVGEPLEIRLLALGAGTYLEVNFDDVRLTADPPPPSSSSASTVTLTLAVNDEGNPTPVKDSMTIDVYDDACIAARIGLDLAADNPGDVDADCDVDIEDLAAMAEKWLNDTGLTEAVPK